MTFVDYQEERLSDPTFNHSIASSPLPFAVITPDTGGYSGLSGYEALASYSLEDPFTLRTLASVTMTGGVSDDPSAPVWSKTTATASVSSSRVTFGFVEGVGAIDQGFMTLSWLVDGQTVIAESTDLGVTLDTTVLTQMTSSASALPLLDELRTSEGTFPAVSSVVTADVEWSANQLVPIDYQLSSTITVEANNDLVNPAGFFMDARAEFGNSVELSVKDFVIMDSAMNVIPTATFNVVAIPEPGSFLFLSLLGLSVGLVRWVVWRGCVDASTNEWRLALSELLTPG